MLLKLFRPVIKSKIKEMLLQYRQFADTRENLSNLKIYLIDIVDEVVKEYINEYKIK
jgi:hypothetical protein